LLAGTPAAVKAEQLVDRLIDFSSFMIRVLKVKPERFRGGKKKVAYHSPCHLCRGMGVVQEPGICWPSPAFPTCRPGRRQLLRHGWLLFHGFPRAFRRGAQEETGRGGGNRRRAVWSPTAPAASCSSRAAWTKRGSKVKVQHIARSRCGSPKPPRTGLRQAG